MTDEEWDRVYELCECLYDKVHDLVDKELKNETESVSYEVRLRMTEQFRFWSRKE